MKSPYCGICHLLPLAFNDIYLYQRKLCGVYGKFLEGGKVTFLVVPLTSSIIQLSSNICKTE